MNPFLLPFLNILSVAPNYFFHFNQKGNLFHYSSIKITTGLMLIPNETTNKRDTFT